MFIEQKKRSILKTFSWRILATIATIVLVYIFTGKIKLALSIGFIEVILKMVLYFLHERLWNKVSFGKKEIEPAVYWFTGLSGSGKSTLSENFYKELKRKGLKVEHLDGDAVRDIFPKTGFSKEDRDKHIKRVGFLASKLEKNGVIVIASFISPYQETRDFVRNLCNNFIEVYVSTPLEVCEERDVKGLYKKARKGEIKQFTGIDDPYEKPTNSEINIDTTHMEINESVQSLINHFNSRN